MSGPGASLAGPQQALELDHRIQGAEKESDASMHKPMDSPNSSPGRDSHSWGKLVGSRQVGIIHLLEDPALKAGSELSRV